MFGIPGKQAVTLTPAAARQIARLMQTRGLVRPAHRRQEGRLRGHGIHDGLSSAESIRWTRVVEQDGARVMIAPMAQMFLFGTEIDYQTSLLEAGFKFRNPNVAEACGCGESIKFKDQPAA